MLTDIQWPLKVYALNEDQWWDKQGMWSQVSLRKYNYKDSGGDGIPAELFQILKDDTVKVLHSVCQQI